MTARTDLAILKALYHLDRETLKDIVITPAAMAGFADRTHVKEGKVVKGWGYQFVSSVHIAAAYRRALRAQN